MTYNNHMLKRLGIFIMISIMLCFLVSGCTMLNDVLSNTPDSSQTQDNADNADSIANGQAPDQTPAAQAPAPELDNNSPWWGTYSADGSNFMISEVSKDSFTYAYTNLYSESYTSGTATIGPAGTAKGDILNFAIDGDMMTVSWTQPLVSPGDEGASTGGDTATDGDASTDTDGSATTGGDTTTGDQATADDSQQGSKVYMRAFEYTEIDSRPLADDKDMISQKDAQKKLTAALPVKLDQGFTMEPAGAVDIEGQPCWAFSPVNNYAKVYNRSVNYAVSKTGEVFQRDDYLSMYVIHPEMKIALE